MKYIKTIIIALAAGCSLVAGAQTASRSGYFLDGYSYRHLLNPAFANDHGFVSIPVLGDFNPTLDSNVGLSTFLYKTPAGSPYKLTTFMSPTVDANTFLNKLGADAHINANLDLQLLSVGFKAFKGFNTISVGVHTDLGLGLPRDLFKFMKLGQDSPDTHYSFSDLKANATAYAQVALGHSHKINDQFTVGGTFKFLMGLANATVHMEKMDIRMGDQQWSVNAVGEVLLSAGSGLEVPTYRETGEDYSNPADADLIDWGEIKYNNFGISGYGAAVDLGVIYTMPSDLLDGMTLSLAVNDLGFMKWNHAIKGQTGTGSWSFDGFKDIAIKSDQEGYEDNKLDNQIDNMFDDLQDFVNIHRKENNSSYNKGLNATIHLGAEYEMPFYKKLTAGFLFTQYIAGVQSWTEGRFYANVKPVKWFDCSLNYGASTYGSSLGWMINFHPRGFNFFVGTDHQIFKVNPWFIPTGNLTTNVNFGFNVSF